MDQQSSFANQASVTGGGVSASASPRRSKLKKGLLTGLLVLLVLEAGAGAAAYVYKIHSPRYVLQQAVHNLTKKDALAANFKFTRGNDANGITISGDMTVRGEKGNQQNGEIVLGVGSAASRVTLTMRLIAGSFYVRADNLENLATYFSSFAGTTPTAEEQTLFEQTFAPYDGQWYSLSKDELNALLKESGSSSINDFPSQAEIQKLQAIYDKHSFLAIDKTFPDETVAGNKCVHVSLKLDNPQLVAFLKDVKKANLKNFQVTDKEIADAAKQPQKPTDGSVEVWVARGDKQLQQLRFSSTAADSQGSFTVTLNNNVAPIDKLQMPANTKSLLELFQGLVPALTGGSPVDGGVTSGDILQS